MAPSSSSLSNNDIILSLHNDYYKQIMWAHYKILGKDRNSEKEISMGQTILNILKDKLSQQKKGGKFYKQAGCGNSFKNLVELDEDSALAKIMIDIQRRMRNDAWLYEKDDDDSDCSSTASSTTSAPMTTTTKSVSPAATSSTVASSCSPSDQNQDNNVILSLYNDYYKQIMWAHYRILGLDRDSDTEKLIGETIFDIFKKKMSVSTTGSASIRMGRRGGKFYKVRGKDKTCSDLEEVDDDAALAKIMADIHRRFRNHAVWSVEAVVTSDTTTAGTPCDSASTDTNVAVNNASEDRGLIEKEKNAAVVSKNCTPAHSPTSVLGIEATEQLGDSQQNFNPPHSASFNEALKKALDSYHKNHTLLKNDNNPPPPVPPPFLSHEEECTIKTALAFVMARARIKCRKETNVSASGSATAGGIDGGIIDIRSGRPSILGGLSLLPPPRRVSPIHISARNLNLELERKFKYVRDVLKLAVSAVLPFYKDALRVNEHGLPSHDGESDTSSRVGKRPCAVYDYEAAVESSNTGNNEPRQQYATLDGLCQHIITRLFSLIRDESLKSRTGRACATTNANATVHNGDGEGGANNKPDTNGGEAPTVVTEQSRGSSSNNAFRDQRSGKQSGQNLISNAIVKLIYNDLIGDAYLHNGSLNSSNDVRECAERRIQKIMAVSHVLHRLLFLDNGCRLGTECVTAICFILSDLYLNQYRGVKFMNHDGADIVEHQSKSNEHLASAANWDKSRKPQNNPIDGERYQIVSSRWGDTSSRSYINHRHDRRRQSVDTLFPRKLHNSERNDDKHAENTNKEEHPLPRIGDVLAVNMLRLLEGAAAIRIHHRQQRVPSSSATSSRHHHHHHHRELMMDKIVQQTAAEVLHEIRASMDHELLLPLHIEDAATFYYTDKMRSTRCIRDSRSRKKNAGGDTSSLVFLQPGAKIMMRLHVFELTNKLALYEQS